MFIEDEDFDPDEEVNTRLQEPDYPEEDSDYGDWD